ncbi:hypothetical protein [Patulibacter sp. SYSU D01012]|uniref:hypothetical protein n=1 Tax=Patulibacter sp. SYSU D01012 TaxID=2817381 RepID=UPI001B309607|nr:hypothetical protein [Patulibacter sp. SYSU D01012]
MTLIIPAPPGEAVAFDDSRPARIAPRSPRNLFAIGTFDRGGVAQYSDVSGLRTSHGQRVNYSPAADEIAAAFAEGGGTFTSSRATGPGATSASVTLDGKLKVTAASPGAWANGLKAEILAPTTDTRRLVITENGTTVATSPTVASVAELQDWASTSPWVRVAPVAAGLPGATAATAATGGADDRANLGVAGWTAALAGLDPRFGPGRLIAPGVTDIAVHAAIIEHCAATNRVAELQLPPDISESDAIEHRQSLAADYPADAWRVNLWASHAYTQPIGSEPERLVGYSALQAGIASFVEREYGIGAAPYGLRRGVSRASRLYRERSTGYAPPGEVQRLYAEHVNVAQDDGQRIYSKGYRTLDGDSTREDGHVAGTRMRLAWQALQRAETYGGEPTDRTTVAEYHADLVAVCKEFAAARAFNTDGDVGYRVDTDAVNTDDSLGRRELHGRIFFRPNGSIHWADVLVGSIRTNEQV